jgi:hypothetical protein
LLRTLWFLPTLQTWHVNVLVCSALQADIFGIVPLSLNEWALVLLFSSPVIFIDEVLKFIGRKFVNPHTELPEKYKQLVADGKLDGKAD